MALIILTRRPARTDDRLWLGLYLGCIVVFGVGELFCRLSIFPDAAMFWTMLSGVGGAATGTTLFLFALAYTNQAGSRYISTVTWLITTTLVVLYFYSYSDVVWDLNIAHIHSYAWGFGNDAGPGMLVVALWLNVLFGFATAMLIRFRRRTTNVLMRKQALLFTFAIVIPAAIGVTNDGVFPAIGIMTPPLAMSGGSVTGLLIVYGVLRYRILSLNPALFSESILALMHESVIVIDDKFNVVYTNSEAREKLNMASAPHAERRLLEFVHSKTDNDHLVEAMHNSRLQGAITIDHINLTNDLGRQVPVRVSLAHLDGQGSAAYVLVLADISAELQSKAIIERTVKQRTRELHEARAYLLSSINSLAQGFVLIGRDQQIVHLNSAATAILNKAGANLEDTDFVAATSQMGWDVKLGPIISKISAKHAPQLLHASTTDGLFYDIFVTPIMSDSEFLGAAIIIENVTEQKILDRSKDEFFSIASHELRTPLTAIRGNLSMIKEYFPNILKDPMAASAISDAHEASVRLIAIVNDFLDSSRLEQGKMKFQLHVVYAKPILETIKRDLAPLITEHQNTLRMVNLDQLPPLYGDTARFQQIVFNVVGNALKYCENADVTVTAETKGRVARLVVTDTGKGISPENQKLLFHKFQQASDSILTRADTKGTGLGLYISKLMANGMGGDLILERSAVDKGSTFVILLPLANARQLAAENKTHPNN